MKILVTGGAGFIGTNLIKRLLKGNHKVTSIDNYYTGLKSNHQKGAIYFEQDISNITDYSEYGDFDLVYHLAAIARIQPSFNLPLEYFKANATATFNLCLHCSKNNIPLQFAGSSSHHSGKFKNPYTFSKDVSEEIVELCKIHYGLKATITRFYNVYGPYHLKEGGYCTVIGKWEKSIEDNKPITIYGDGKKRRDFTHIDDIIDGLWKIGVKNIKHKYSWELGTGLNYSINDVYLMFKERFGVDYTNIPNQSGNYRVTLRENDDSLDKLNWKPSDKLRDYILSLNKD